MQSHLWPTALQKPQGPSQEDICQPSAIANKILRGIVLSLIDSHAEVPFCSSLRPPGKVLRAPKCATFPLKRLDPNLHHPPQPPPMHAPKRTCPEDPPGSLASAKTSYNLMCRSCLGRCCAQHARYLSSAHTVVRFRPQSKHFSLLPARRNLGLPIEKLTNAQCGSWRAPSHMHP